MRRDTKRRIELYEGRLPHVREKLSAAGLGLLVAAVVAVQYLSAKREKATIK